MGGIHQRERETTTAISHRGTCGTNFMPSCVPERKASQIKATVYVRRCKLGDAFASLSIKMPSKRGDCTQRGYDSERFKWVALMRHEINDITLSSKPTRCNLSRASLTLEG